MKEDLVLGVLMVLITILLAFLVLTYRYGPRPEIDPDNGLAIPDLASNRIVYTRKHHSNQNERKTNTTIDN